MTPSSIRKLNPATGALLAEIPCTDVAQVPLLVAQARAAQQAWGRTPVAVRGRMLRQVAAVLADQAAALGQLIAAETGKPCLEAVLNEVFNVAHLAGYFGKHAARILKPQSIRLSLFWHKRSYLHHVPRGVVGVIAPWNFPLSLALGDTLMALCAGNAVVLKPSEHTPLCGLEIKKIIEAAGIDAALVQVATGYGDVGAAVVRGGVDMVHFTGSVPTGKKIAQACGELLLPHVLELGGKDAAIVLEDADIEHAARTLVHGAFLNAGQACASVERVYAVGQAYAPLVERLIHHTQALRQGDGSTADVDVGPMIVPQQLDVVREHVDSALAQGAQVRTGGAAKGPYFAPTVLTDVHDDMDICRRETFGPVLPVMRAESVDEAIQRANGSVYGLSAYVFTRNLQRGRQIAERLQAGTVDVNDVLYTHALPETPWGGIKHSGIGHTHADAGLRHMCQTHHINYSPLPAFVNVWTFPYKRALLPPCYDLLQGLFGRRSWPVRLGLLCRGVFGALRALRSPREEQ